jgi:hypothetical protein
MLKRTFEKPDSAHPQQMLEEARARFIMRTIWSGYAVAMALTFAFQIVIRLDACSGSAQCGISLAKAVPWSILLPFYWVFYVNG